MSQSDPQEPVPPAPRRRSGQLEAQVVTVLVDAERPLTPGEVLERLGESSGLSYSTVVTTLTRLYAKGAVTRKRHGRPYRYGAVADAAALSASRMSRLLAEEPDRASVLRRFVNALDPADEQTLRALLEETDD